MKLLVFRALWGMTGPLAEQLERIAAAGYDGFEMWVTGFNESPQEVIALAKQYRLKMIAATAIPTQAELDPMLKHLAEYEPLRINVQSGRDSMTRDEGRAYFETSLKIEETLGVPVSHETHRGKILFTPWDTAYYLRQFDKLRLTADYSHWVNVCERLPEDEAESVNLANSRVAHIHGRVGYEEGPQVPDPSAPEYAAQLAWHEAQWKAIRDNQASSAQETLTFTPEYGPPGYLHTLPHTNVPVADLWQVCLWAMRRARQQMV